LKVIAMNFCRLRNTNFNDLPPDTFLALLRHKRLAVQQEHQLFKIVCQYVRSRSHELDEDTIYKLFENVRFRWMSSNQLREEFENPLVPRSLINEAAMTRLMKFECLTNEKLNNDLLLRLQPRPKCALIFDFHEKSTEFFNGIIGWIATNNDESTDEALVFRNPHLNGKVKVHSNSIAKGSRWMLVDKCPQQVWTDDVPSSWFSIDFGPHRLITLTYYSLRHGGNYKADSLRTWDLQGSIDGVQWKTITRHHNDNSLNGPYATHSWFVKCKECFRFFRVLQTGRNSSHHNFLVLSGFEFYGMLFDNTSEN